MTSTTAISTRKPDCCLPIVFSAFAGSFAAIGWALGPADGLPD